MNRSTGKKKFKRTCADAPQRILNSKGSCPKYFLVVGHPSRSLKRVLLSPSKVYQGRCLINFPVSAALSSIKLSLNYIFISSLCYRSFLYIFFSFISLDILQAIYFFANVSYFSRETDRQANVLL